MRSAKLFDLLARTGLVLIFVAGILTFLKPIFPDVWVEEFANLIHSDFDKLAKLAVQGLELLSFVGVGCCLSSLLVHEE